MAVPVVADADTLFDGTTRGLLIHLDYQGLIRLHWSPLILDEMSRALVETGRKAGRAAATRHEALMRAALPQAEVPTADVQSQFEAVSWAMRSAKGTLRPVRPERERLCRSIRRAALRGTLRSNPTPEQLLERLAADGQIETAAAILASRQAGTAAI